MKKAIKKTMVTAGVVIGIVALAALVVWMGF